MSYWDTSSDTGEDVLPVELHLHKDPLSLQYQAVQDFFLL